MTLSFRNLLSASLILAIVYKLNPLVSDNSGEGVELNYSSDHDQNYAIQGIDELGMLQPEFEKNGFTSKEQCQTYYGRMAYFYEIREATGDQFFQDQNERFLALKAACK